MAIPQITDDPVEFCSMGMFILGMSYGRPVLATRLPLTPTDDIDFGGARPKVENALGGAASFAVAGARLVSGRQHARALSWIVDVGSDFPADVLETLRAWDTNCVFREDQTRLTTRAWNGYGPNEKRGESTPEHEHKSMCPLIKIDFKYLTPKLRLTPSMLSESQVFSRTFHMVCSASRAMEMVDEIVQRRQQLRDEGKAPADEYATKRPVFVWEPVPDRCTPEELELFFQAARAVDVVSPNELELGMMFGQEGWCEDSAPGREIVRRILQSGIGPDGRGMLVIRAGKDGSYAYTQSQRVWLPAYHEPGSSEAASAVVDPTGAGNSYLGALAQGMVTTDREPDRTVQSVLAGCPAWNEALTHWQAYLPALVFATVAAGFVVEQIGVPHLQASASRELWNGSEFTERVRLYTERLSRTLAQSPHTHFQLAH